MVVLGITGGIGTGKSYVAAVMARRGIPVYDSDSRAKWLMQNDASLKLALAALVGDGLYGPDGVFDRRVMAGAVFGDPEMKGKVESLVHPAVGRDFETWAAGQNSEFVLLESAILFESGFDRFVDAVIVVDAPLELRISRCMERDGVSRDAVIGRIDSQMPQQRKVELGNFVILNDGCSDLESQVDSILDSCKTIYKNNRKYD